MLKYKFKVGETMYTYDIINGLEQAYEDDLYSLLDCLDCLYKQTNSEDYLNEYKKLCDEHEICPKCHGKLIETYYFGEPLEHFGFPCREKHLKLQCENCGYIQI